MSHDSEFDIDMIPELDTQIGMIGAMTQVEVGGQICLETGVLIISHL
jgi:hypothetical protein